MVAKPRIGINGDYRREEKEKTLLASGYYDAVADAGGVPLILPPLESEGAIGDLLHGVDGVLLSGGNDYDPAHFGAAVDDRMKLVHRRRDLFDLHLARAIVSRRIPCLGICGGAQILSIACGGDLVADIRQAHPEAIDHEERAGRPVFHDVDVSAGSRLEQAVGSTSIRVNSLHHQAIRRPGEGLRVVGRSPDGVVEAVEGEGPFLLGVQWHPELMRSVEVHRRIFEALVGACRL